MNKRLVLLLVVMLLIVPSTALADNASVAAGGATLSGSFSVHAREGEVELRGSADLEIDPELEAAVRNGQARVWYQVIINLGDQATGPDGIIANKVGGDSREVYIGNVNDAAVWRLDFGGVYPVEWCSGLYQVEYQLKIKRVTGLTPEGDKIWEWAEGDEDGPRGTVEVPCPTPTATPSNTPTPTRTPEPSPTVTPTATQTATNTATATATQTGTIPPTVPPSTIRPSGTPTVPPTTGSTETPVPSGTPTSTPTATPQPTATLQTTVSEGENPGADGIPWGKVLGVLGVLGGGFLLQAWVYRDRH